MGHEQATHGWNVVCVDRKKRKRVVEVPCACYDNVVESDTYFVLECPLYNSIRDMFSSLFHNIIVLGILKSFYQLDHQIDTSLWNAYLAEANALRYLKEIPLITSFSIWCTSHPLNMLTSWTLANFFLFQVEWLTYYDIYTLNSVISTTLMSFLLFMLLLYFEPLGNGCS